MNLGPIDRPNPWLGCKEKLDSDAVLILEVYSKQTRKIPEEVVTRCKDRLKRYDAVVAAAKRKSSRREG